ncbi:MAG TPA: hypothetical protein VFH27_05595 [Longimicrobiaceae bacterium]|nr:hypothetical protein [Longimicrobiaceae bacterium]
MSFTLEITVAGLCVLVPDRTKYEMHVLMPRTRGGTHGCGNFHEARIYYDPKYLTGDSSAQDVPPAKWKWDNIFGGSATLAGTGAVQPSIPDKVLPIPAKVHADCFQDDGGQRLDARITLRNTTFQAVTPGSIWYVPGPGERELVFQATWTMVVDAPTLKWNMKPLGAGNAPHTTELKPVDTPAGKLLRLKILHGDPHELPEVMTGSPPEPDYDAPPEHVGACLKSVFPGVSLPDVRYRRKVMVHQKPEKAKEKEKDFDTATTFSCMLTQGDMP